MRKTFYLKILFILFSSQLFAQAPTNSFKTDKALEKKLQVLVNNFQGVAGIYVKHLKKIRALLFKQIPFFQRQV
jgi:hypothetical protein